MGVDLDHKKANFRECIALFKSKVKKNSEIYNDYNNPNEID